MSNFSEAYRQLTPRQKLVVDTIEGPVLVIAGPGTGKTHVLTVRIANILDKTDASPTNILCLTFTDSAVQTMRERLAGLTGLGAHTVTFSTYHAFGSELIKRYPHFFTDLSEAQPVDELGISTIISDLLDKAPYSNPLKHGRSSMYDAKSTISEFKRALLTPDDVRQIALSNRQFIEETSHETSALLSTLKRIDKASVGLFEQLAEKTRISVQQEKTFPVPLSTLWQEELEAALMAVENSGKTTALTEWKNKWLAKNSQNMFIVEGIRTVQRLEALADIYDQYLQTLTAKGLYDYDDMILQAIKGLETYSELRYSLQEQYLYILLDEFQDTNEAQMRLVELLSDNPVNEGRPNVMAVGDDDQAIFGFQGAHYSHMLRFMELYREVNVVDLVENFRSHRDILSLADSVSSNIEQRLVQKIQQASKQLKAANALLPKDAHIEHHNFVSDIEQYAWIAHEVKRLTEQGIPPREIALIAPRHKYLEPMVAHLHHAGLPVRYEKRENILDDPIIKQLSTMVGLTLALKDKNYTKADSLWPEVLSFPFWKLPTNEIWELSWKAHDSQKTWLELMNAKPNLEVIAMFFVRLSLLVNTENLETMLDYIIGIQPLELLTPTTPLYNAPLYGYYSESETQLWTLLSHLTVLREKLRTYKPDSEEPLSLHDFNEFVAAYHNADLKLLNTSPYYEATDAVQLMTVYKAKGQEFATVFVLACLEEVWGTKAKGQFSRIALPPNLHYVRYAGMTEDERIRLLYVAVTRAKHHLYFTSYSSTFDGRLTTHLPYLPEPLAKQHSALGTVEPTNPTLTSQHLALHWQHSHSTRALTPALHALLEGRLKKYRLSPTHLNAFTDVIYGGPESFYINTILRFPKSPTPNGQFGNAMHETLEWLHAQNRRAGRLPSLNQTQSYFTQRLIGKRLSKHHYDQLLERGLASLEIYLKQRRHTIRPENECEQAFYNEGVFVGDAHLSGKIDKLIIDKKSKTITVVDYKTGKSFSRWVDSEAKLHKYRQQLYFYKLLIEGSQTFAGYHVTDAYLEFIEPNEEGNITELHLEFSDNYMQRIKDLVAVMWRHVHALDFPSIDQYPATAKGIIAFEDDLLNELI